MPPHHCGLAAYSQLATTIPLTLTRSLKIVHTSRFSCAAATCHLSQGLAFDDDGFSFSPQEATSGSSYQEYNIVNVTAELVNYVYPCCPNEPWPAALYTVSLKRATSFYAVCAIACTRRHPLCLCPPPTVPCTCDGVSTNKRLAEHACCSRHPPHSLAGSVQMVIIVPTIIITILSFVVFFLPTGEQDALGFGITIIVVVILMHVVMIGMLPVCQEPLWINYFVTLNMVRDCNHMQPYATTTMTPCNAATLPNIYTHADLHPSLNRIWHPHTDSERPQTNGTAGLLHVLALRVLPRRLHTVP